MNRRMLAVLLVLPLVALGCGGEEKDVNPFGLACTVHVGGAAPPEDLWCIAAAYDYSQFPPEYASTTWGFIISAYRGTSQVGAGGGIFLDGRPTPGVAYSWSGSAASTLIASGGFSRYDATMQLTHASSTLGNGSSGEGSATITFSAIPPASATDEQLIGVHGIFSATLPPVGGSGGNVTLSATF